jgi:thioester reductase-like protein/aryl carrier-like protein
LIVSSYYGSVPIFALPGTPPTTESFLEAINATDADWSFVPPVVIDEMGKSPELLEKLVGRSSHLFFTGGAVPKASGDIVAKRLPIWQVLGSSECASLPLVHALESYDNTEDWQYIQTNPLLGLDMRHQYDDLHELVVKRSSDAESYLPVFTHFPDTQEFATKDLFRKHPSKPDLWIYASRNDDLIVFLNGEKTNPITFEETVGGHPDVKAALVVGAQRFEAALLVELATPNTAPISASDKKAIIESIWPTVQKANEVTPAHARVSKSKILLVDYAKPMLRAPKGTIQRNATLQLYADEIEQLYKQDEEVGEEASSDGADVKSAIRNVVAELLGWDDLNFFQLGMDSLGVLRLQRALKRHLPSITLNTIYNSASVNALAKEIESASATNGEAVAKDPTAELAQLLESYQKKIDLIPASTAASAPAGPATILVTGTTGALGSYVVNRLLQLPETEIKRIYCFNRAKDAKARQTKNCAARGLGTEFPDDRVVFLNGDLAKPNFGLPDEAAFNELLNSVTLLIHNAWPVNFNLSLTSFVPSVDGVMGLINFAAASPKSPVIQFFSSISSVDRFPGNTVPEHVIEDLGTPELMGYGQSKYLSERLLDYATQHLGIKTISVRIGQVAGAARTATGWNRQEWLPSLVVSSAFINALPATIGDVLPGGGEEMINWVPMDYLADVLVELGLNTKPHVSSAANGVTIYQVTHPNPVPWSKLLPAISKGLKESGISSDLPVISYLDWFAQLKAKSAEAEESTDQSNAALLAHNNPAMKLIDFFWGVQYQGDAGLRQQLAMDKTLQVSPILKGMEPLKPEWVEGWTKDWMKAPWRGH